MELLGTKLLNEKDFTELLFRFLFDFIVMFVIVRMLYYPTQKRKDYLFTYIIFNILIFFISFLLSNVKLQLGFAFGLFAVFGILRYRTEALPIKEMTYLFIVIGLAIINALANKKISWAELVFTNMAILGATYALEKMWLLRHETQKLVVYDNLELIKPENRDKLIEDLNKRTGLTITRTRLEKIDFLRDVAFLHIFYYEDKAEGYINSADNSDDDD
ncbi:MAG: hypothetical protein POELPBGB_00421 [Bacteroidia bacterium]|nr:hypothetical protein [Bacteroidia bacterium]